MYPDKNIGLQKPSSFYVSRNLGNILVYFLRSSSGVESRNTLIGRIFYFRIHVYAQRIYKKICIK